MPKSKHGAELQIGDRVYLSAVVAAVAQDGGNGITVNVETGTLPEALSLGGELVEHEVPIANVALGT